MIVTFDLSLETLDKVIVQTAAEFPLLNSSQSGLTTTVSKGHCLWLLFRSLTLAMLILNLSKFNEAIIIFQPPSSSFFSSSSSSAYFIYL